MALEMGMSKSTSDTFLITKTSSSRLDQTNELRGNWGRGGRKRDCILFCNEYVRIPHRLRDGKFGLVQRQ